MLQQVSFDRRKKNESVPQPDKTKHETDVIYQVMQPAQDIFHLVYAVWNVSFYELNREMVLSWCSGGRSKIKILLKGAFFIRNVDFWGSFPIHQIIALIDGGQPVSQSHVFWWVWNEFNQNQLSSHIAPLK